MEKEKLIVSNFGPIKHVELDIKKINVLIGEQGTGKSALVKLLYHFTTKNFLFGNKNDSREEFQETFFFNEKIQIEYLSSNFEIKYTIAKLKIVFVGKYKNQLERFSIVYKQFIAKFDQEYKDEFYSLSKWFDENILQNTYIPAERIGVGIVDRIGNNLREGLDHYLINFYRGYASARVKISELTIPYLKNVVFRREDLNDIVVFNGENLLLRGTSSGFQSSIPMTVFIEYFTSIKDKIRFIIEEPELNLFPTTQYELVKYLVEKTNPEKNGLFIATHSPYILASINNLLLAGKYGSDKIDNEIIDRKYWLDINDVSAYMLLPNGEIEDIMDKDSGQIKAEKIDGASQIISTQYEKIMDTVYSL